MGGEHLSIFRRDKSFDRGLSPRLTLHYERGGGGEREKEGFLIIRIYANEFDQLDLSFCDNSIFFLFVYTRSKIR